jgi:uncharacterized membrane-anchored protein YitT (DUF2179 family)
MADLTGPRVASHAPPRTAPEARPSVPHRPHDDAQAYLAGTLFIALGTMMFGHAGLLTGGTVGIAFLVSYGTGWPFGLVFFCVNLPFYLLAWRRMGRGFTLRTGIAVTLMSALSQALPHLIGFSHLAPVLAAVMGGLLVGAGLLILFRHQASLGGMNVLVLHVQERLGWRAGWVQLGIDSLILLAGASVADAGQLALSVLGAVVMNLTLAINHRPGRYLAV